MADILIVEDETVSANALSALLRHAGHRVQWASTGHEALGAIMHEVPDLVVLDLGLPGPNGASVLSLLRDSLHQQGLPVIVWTGMAEGDTLEKVKSLGAAAVIIKGQTPPEAILEEIQKALG